MHAQYTLLPPLQVRQRAYGGAIAFVQAFVIEPRSRRDVGNMKEESWWHVLGTTRSNVDLAIHCIDSMAFKGVGPLLKPHIIDDHRPRFNFCR